VRERLIFAVALLLVAIGALAFRLPNLDNRSMHADEAVQAARFRKLWQDGHYRYDPNEFHGPTLAYTTLAAPWIEGPRKSFAETTETTYRIVPVIFGTGLVLLLLLLGDGLGRVAAVCGGVLTAISPTMVFFSRYYIHETLFVFFTLAAIAAGWRYACSRRLVWCLITGGCLGLMQATKETSVIVFFSMGVGILLTWLCMCVLRNAPADLKCESESGQTGRTLVWHLSLGLAVAFLVTVILLSSFFTNPRGPIDGILTYLPWLSRAGGASPHIHPFYHYLHILTYWQNGEGPVWSEVFVLALAVLGCVAAVLPEKTGLLRGASVVFVRWLGFYTVLLTAAYACIPYKTPWCLLGFLHGMILLAGVGAVVLVRAVRTLPIKTWATIVLLAAATQFGWQSYCTSFVYHNDRRNPYVYAGTSPKIDELAEYLDQLAMASPEGHDVLVKVIWHDGYYWPLPWYLRQFKSVGCWDVSEEDENEQIVTSLKKLDEALTLSAPIVISSEKLDEAMTKRLDQTHLMTDLYGLRPNVLAQVWVRMDLWEAHLRRLGRL